MPAVAEKEPDIKLTVHGYMWKGVKIEHLQKSQLKEALITMIHKYEALSKYQ